MNPEQPSREPFIGGIQSEKVVVIHTMSGPLTITNSALRSADAVVRKKWRPLATFAFPLDADTDAEMQRFFRHLMVNMYREFAAERYIEFSSLVTIDGITEVAGSNVVPMTLLSQYASFTGALTNSLRILWSKTADGRATDEARSCQDSLNKDLRYLYDNFTINIMIARSATHAYNFVCDAASRVIGIQPHDDLLPADSFHEATRGTSGLLRYIAALVKSPIAYIDLDKVFNSYSLLKLCLAVLDKKFDPNHVRVNLDDPEEWDYLNPKVDEELKRSPST